ncbi:MAG TPA: primosomal protein N' [Patescibacteria group bacterium]
MFAEIIPIKRFPRKIFFFDYLISDDLKDQIRPGHLAEIPFKNRLLAGLVINIKSQSETPEATIKQVKSLLAADQILYQPQTDLILDLADYYNISPGHILKNILPDIPKRRLARIPPALTVQTQAEELSVKKDSLSLIKSNFREIETTADKPFLLHYQSKNDKETVIFKTAERILKDGGQIIYLVPRISLINSLAALYKKLGPVAVLHGQLAKSTYWDQWQKISQNQAKIIIGTRTALFAPVKSLKLIMVDSEESSDYKQSEQNPRYDARLAAEKLSGLTKSKLIYCSQSPQIISYYKSQQNKYKLLNLSAITPKKTEIVDLNMEIKAGNYGSVSYKLQTCLENALQDNKKVLLYLDQRGYSPVFACLDCSYIFKCPDCRLPFACHLNKLNCHRCFKEEPILSACPECRGANLKTIGYGTRRLEEEVKKLFSKAKILTVDKDVKTVDLKQSYQILIGTQYLLQNYPQLLLYLGLVAVVTADNLFYIPDFMINETIFQKINSLINLPNSNAKFIIQTLNPENFVIQAAAQNNYQKFFNQEIKNRKEFNYPPFVRLIKLTYKNQNIKKADFEANNLYQHLKNKSKNLSIEILPPISGLKQHNKFIRNIIIKLPLNLRSKTSEILDPVYSDWIIDIDPVSLL